MEDKFKGNYKKVNYADELKKASEIDGNKYIEQDKLIENLKWMENNCFEIYKKNNQKVEYVYYFEYKGGIHRVSAVTLKVNFANHSAWYQYSAGDKLYHILNNTNEKSLTELINSNEEIKINIDKWTCNFPSSEKQIRYVNMLLQENGYSFQIKNISSELSNIIISTIKANKKIKLIFNGKEFSKKDIKIDFENSTEEEINEYLDNLLRKNKNSKTEPETIDEIIKRLNSICPPEIKE